MLDRQRQEGESQLRAELQGREQESIDRLREQLASRNLLDSGSLGAGTVSVERDISKLLQQGVSQGRQQQFGKQADALESALNRTLERQKAVSSLAQDSFNTLASLGLKYDELSQQDKEFLTGLSVENKKLRLQQDNLRAELDLKKLLAEQELSLGYAGLRSREGIASADRESAEDTAFWQGIGNILGGGVEALVTVLSGGKSGGSY